MQLLIKFVELKISLCELRRICVCENAYGGGFPRIYCIRTQSSQNRGVQGREWEIVGRVKKEERKGQEGEDIGEDRTSVVTVIIRDSLYDFIRAF